MNRLFAELRRRNVFRAGTAYLVFAWLLVQVADILLVTFIAPVWAMQVLVVALFIGFPVALAVAWFYELTSHGIKPDAETDEHMRPMLAGRQIDFIIIGVLIAALALFAAERFRWIELGEDDARGPVSIAVLPFAYLGPETGSEHFADAMTEELIGRLGRVASVQVKSRLSVARFKDTDREVPDIASELDVDLVLEGSVRKVGERVRVTTQLTDASSGFEQWSDVFDGESDDWFALHEDLAVKIARSLNLHLSPDEHGAIRSHFTDNREAYEEFWRGWLLLESFHVDDSHPRHKIESAISHLDRALKLDPDYPLAIAGLSLANSYAYMYGVNLLDEQRERAMDLARRALSLNPDFAEGYVALGMAIGTYGNNEGSISALEKALEIDPDSAVTWCLLAAACIFQSPPDARAGEVAARTSIRNDPTWTYSYIMLGRSLALQGRHDEAVQAYRDGAVFNPGFYSLQFELGDALLSLGKYNEALDALDVARGIRETPEVLVSTAAAYSMLGDLEQSLEHLRQGLEAGFEPLDAILGSPYFKPISLDPGFEELLAGAAGG